MTAPGGNSLKKFVQNSALAIVSLCLFLLVSEAILAALGVHPNPQSLEHSLQLPESMRLYVPKGDSFSTHPEKRLLFHRQSFPAVKQENAFRIFTLGGSTTYGRPYEDGTSFTGWLRAYLKELAPDTQWEVINSGGISYASYRIAYLVEELVQYDPDLFILYSGHNEFLEERTLREIKKTPQVLRSLDHQFSKTRLYSHLKRSYHRFMADSPDVSDTASNTLPSEVVTKLEKTIGPTSYERNDSLKRLIHGHYRKAMNTIIETSRKHKVPLLLISTPSNLKDCSPFKSQPDDTLSLVAQQSFQSTFRTGESLYHREDYKGAASAFRRAVKIDPRHGHARYYLGKSLLASGNENEAALHFIKARDEDVCPLRANSEILEIQESLGRNAAIYYLDWARILEEQSSTSKGHSILGEEEFLDHVHPTIASHRKLALEILRVIDSTGLFPLPERDSSILAAVSQSVHQKLGNPSHGRALHNLAKVTHWAGKHEEAVRIARKAISVDTLDKEAFSSFFLVGTALHRQHQVEEALKYYQGAYGIDSNHHQLNQYMGKLYLEQAKYPQAYRHFNHALKIQPDDLETRQELGLLSFRLKKYSEALEHFKALVARRPSSPNLRYNLGKAFLLTGNTRKASLEWNKTLRLSPGHPGALAGLKQLKNSGF